MIKVIDYLPEIEGDEALYIKKLMEGMDEKTASRFASVYRARRKNPQTILLTCLLGFFLIAGIHRILLNQVGMGVLYIFTAGLCFIGTIVDLINYREMTFEHNRTVAQEILSLL